MPVVSVQEPQRGDGAYNFLVCNDTELRKALSYNEHVAWLAVRPTICFWIDFEHGALSNVVFYDPTWRELTRIARDYVIHVYNPVRQAYEPWTGKMNDLRRFTSLTIELKTTRAVTL